MSAPLKIPTSVRTGPEHGFVESADARTVLDALVSEKALTSAVLDMLDYHGWIYYHLPDEAMAEIVKARRWNALPNRGLPDLLAIRDDVLLVSELKAGTGRVRPEQRVWLDAFRRVRVVHTCLWRPRDRDEIERMIV